MKLQAVSSNLVLQVSGPVLGHAGHLAVQLGVVVQGEAGVDEGSAHSERCLQLCQLVLNLQEENMILNVSKKEKHSPSAGQPISSQKPSSLSPSLESTQTLPQPSPTPHWQSPSVDDITWPTKKSTYPLLGQLVHEVVETVVFFSQQSRLWNPQIFEEQFSSVLLIRLMLCQNKVLENQGQLRFHLAPQPQLIQLAAFVKTRQTGVNEE